MTRQSIPHAAHRRDLVGESIGRAEARHEGEGPAAGATVARATVRDLASVGFFVVAVVLASAILALMDIAR